MLKPKPRPATYADIEALPPNMVGEIIHGVLHAHPRPAPRLAFAKTRLGAELSRAFDRKERGGEHWYVLCEPELHFGGAVVVPDVAGWKRERLTPFPETAFITTPPDWLAEVLSPSTQALDRTSKLGIYAANGVAHCWYVDPIAKTLEVLALTGAKYLIEATFRDADAVTAPPFEVHTFGLDVLWVE